MIKWSMHSYLNIATDIVLLLLFHSLCNSLHGSRFAFFFRTATTMIIDSITLTRDTNIKPPPPAMAVRVHILTLFAVSVIVVVVSITVEIAIVIQLLFSQTEDFRSAWREFVETFSLCLCNKLDLMLRVVRLSVDITNHLNCVGGLSVVNLSL